MKTKPIWIVTKNGVPFRRINGSFHVSLIDLALEGMLARIQASGSSSLDGCKVAKFVEVGNE